MRATGSGYRKVLRVGFPSESSLNRAGRGCLQHPDQSGQIETLTRAKRRARRRRREREQPRRWSSTHLDWRPSAVLAVEQCRRGSAKQGKAKPRQPRRGEQKAAVQKG